jgi:hypothetical protein
MTQALYAYMNNKKIKIKKINNFEKFNNSSTSSKNTCFCKLDGHLVSEFNKIDSRANRVAIWQIMKHYIKH